MSAALYGVDRRHNVADIDLDLVFDLFSNVGCGRRYVASPCGPGCRLC
ncbi:MAG: hypothetical protein HZA66_05395 [Rhodopseudomonas palustris]|uniref:Uncharacterized protein n=1 Tax=Rhodopseudomonas palustris TaxID=1076 RepID=A0A933VZW9_RHOPL|nr:hypothetical protein [Rhodopseudomonas palustris]